MGMFDNFVTSEKIYCPKCNKEFIDRDSDLPYDCVLQSKALECMLDVYEQGKPIQIKKTISNFYIKDGWIEAHGICENCKSYVQFKLIIEDGVWTKIENFDI